MTGARSDGEPDLAWEIEQAAVRLLAGREHSRGELGRKLAGRGYPPPLIDEVLESLERRGWLSEHRYAESYIASRRRKGYGPLRIRAELRERGVASAVIDDQLDDSAAAWSVLMAEVAERRFGSDPACDRREQARRGRFLQQRGFSPEMIRQLLWE